MSSTKDKHGEFIFECDDCGETYASSEREFKDAWEEAQGEGWKYRGNDTHQCPSCAQGTFEPKRPNVLKDDPYASFRSKK